MTSKLEKLSDILVNDTDFCQKVLLNLNSIKKDGKIDARDIPDMVSIIITCYNEKDDFEIEEEEIPEFVTLVVRLLLHKYDVVREDEYEEIDRIVQMCIQLAMTQVITKPAVQNKLKELLSKCFPCFS